MNPFATLAKADRQLRTIRKANPSQSLGGIVIPDGHRMPAPVGKITPDELILKGFKANVFAYTCVDRLASFAAQAFWRVEERVGDNEWQPREGDWRNKLLAYPMGSKVSAQEVFYYFGAWLAIAGNGLLRKIPGGENGILELVPMTPKNIEPIPDREEWISGYNLIEDGKVKFNKVAENQPTLEACIARLEEVRMKFLRMGGSQQNIAETYTLTAAEVGGTANGTYTLKVVDNAAQDVGTINSVKLAFSAAQ